MSLNIFPSLPYSLFHLVSPGSFFLFFVSSLLFPLTPHPFSADGSPSLILALLELSSKFCIVLTVNECPELTVIIWHYRNKPELNLNWIVLVSKPAVPTLSNHFMQWHFRISVLRRTEKMVDKVNKVHLHQPNLCTNDINKAIKTQFWAHSLKLLYAAHNNYKNTLISLYLWKALALLNICWVTG